MVTETTGNKAMYYVGHSMGTSMLTVLLSMRPEYNDRILTGFLLSPAIHFGNTAPQLRFFMRGSNYFQTTLSILLGAFPDVISTKTWTHYVQLIHTDQFCQFNYGFKTKNREKYGSDSPPCYNLSKVTAPIVIYWGHNDIFVRPQDAAKSASKFPSSSLKEFNKVDDPLFTHLDFTIAKDADVLLYDQILSTMMNATYE
ncbi:lipase 1 [Folsomia candida]|uniref:lipase 1 n=1 Tax=Folsomia candida TaxID=158441 RepID=UPI000B8FB5B8|nr:lipase 1 [Folsomia candida]